MAPANVLATAGFDVHLAKRRSRFPQVTVETETEGAPVPALLERSELARLLVVGHRCGAGSSCAVGDVEVPDSQ